MAVLFKRIIAFLTALSVLGLAVRAEEWPVGGNEIQVPEDAQYTTALQVAREGRYMLCFEYYAEEQSRLNPLIEVELSGNGLSFLKPVELFRVWQDIRSGERFTTDYRGNELIPEQRQVFAWQKTELLNKGVPFALEAGEYEVSVTALREGVLLRNIHLAEYAPDTYQTYEKSVENEPADTKNAAVIKIEAELMSAKSSSSIIPAYENSYPAISPSSPDKTMLNIVGGGVFADEGQWIEWEFDVKYAGFYSFDFRYRQDALRGLGVRRKITLDGSLAFEELNEYLFMYADNFTSATVNRNGEAFKFYLSEGIHTLKLQAVLGALEGPIDILESSLRDMSGIYRDIIAVTGYSPDMYRDYILDKEIPDLLPRIEQVKSDLAGVAADISTGSDLQEKGSETAVIDETVRILESLVKTPEKIQNRIDSYKAQMDTLAVLIQTLKKQPLELDYINIVPAGRETPVVKQSFFANLFYRMKVLLHSFSADYLPAENGKEPIQVWVNTSDLMTSSAASGREQAQLLKRICDQRFTPDFKIPVEISLVSTSDILTQAIVSGKGPDAAAFVPKQTVINLAARKALGDMRGMSGFDAAQERFYPSAFTAYQYKDGIYAMPQTQSFNMMFYRTDIFEDLGLSPPETWEDFYITLEFLQQHKMQAGIAEDVQIFEMLLMQNGGHMYNDGLTQTQLSSGQSVKAFTDWTNLYVKYSVPLSFDFLNRFRVGEMPLGLASYTMYNQLIVAAPEISGLWAMTGVPGIEENGKINRAESCIVNGTVVIARSKRLEDSYAFVNWFTSDEIQTEFGVQSEIVLGQSGRYNTANKQAFENLNWTNAEKTALKAQWEQVRDIPQTPASYYLNRSLTNAFRKVVYSYENQRDVIYQYGKDVDRELARKTEELG